MPSEYDAVTNNSTSMTVASSGGYLGVEENVQDQTFNTVDYAFTGGNVSDWYSNAVSPLVIPINLEDASEFLLTQTDAVQQGAQKIYEVTFSVTFKMRSFNKANAVQLESQAEIDRKWIWEYPPPYFKVGAHRIPNHRLTTADVDTELS